jgi:carboxylesterase
VTEQAAPDHPPVLAGAEPFSAAGDRRGALVLHGFTGSPMSMRPIAEAFAAAGWTVELPRLPGHGTTVEDMANYGWPDWTAAAEAAHADLAARTDRMVVVGLSMGGALTLHLAAGHPEIAGIVLVNPAVAAADFAPLLEQVRSGIAGGARFAPGVGNDVADPEVVELAYPTMPLESLLSFGEGLVELEPRLPSVAQPALVLHSTEDHVVPPGSVALLERTLAGPHELVTLDRSFHVATIDYDKDLIVERALAFAETAVAG